MTAEFNDGVEDKSAMTIGSKGISTTRTIGANTLGTAIIDATLFVSIVGETEFVIDTNPDIEIGLSLSTGFTTPDRTEMPGAGPGTGGTGPGFSRNR